MIFTGFVNGPLTVLAGVAVAVALVSLLQRFFDQRTLAASHGTTGNLLAVVGTLYAVMLGLVVVDAMVRFERAIDVVQAESTALADIHIMAERLPEPFGSRVKGACRDYAVAVVETEWERLAERGEPSIEARRAGLRVLRSLDGYEPETESQKALYPMIVQEMQAAWDHRRERIATAHYGVPAVEWVALLLGALVTVTLGGLFPFGHFRFHLLVTSLAALVMVLNLYLVSLFGYPFSGDLRVSDLPFRTDIGIFDGLYDEPANAEGRPAEPAHPVLR